MNIYDFFHYPFCISPILLKNINSLELFTQWSNSNLNYRMLWVLNALPLGESCCNSPFYFTIGPEKVKSCLENVLGSIHTAHYSTYPLVIRISHSSQQRNSFFCPLFSWHKEPDMAKSPSCSSVGQLLCPLVYRLSPWILDIQTAKVKFGITGIEKKHF